jgi:deubiquitinase DESI2
MAYSSIGRRRATVSVYVNIYDLSPANEWVLHTVGLGLYHSGIEVLGSEYTFAANAGIFHHSPRDAGPQAQFRSQLLIGTFEGGPAEVQTAVRVLESSTRFGPDDYDILQNNCNTFANALCLQLCQTAIPVYVNRIANYGVFCKCLIPQSILKGSPVNQQNPTSEQRSESTAFLVPRNNNNRSAEVAMTAFSGTGSKLGGTTTGNMDTAATATALTDRRDKARLAALARLEQQQQQQQHSSNDDKSS